jgi:hypothetical protein
MATKLTIQPSNQSRILNQLAQPTMPMNVTQAVMMEKKTIPT